MNQIPRGYDGFYEELKADATPLRTPYNHRYTAHPIVPMARMMREPSFKHVPWGEVADAIRLSMIPYTPENEEALDRRWDAWHAKNNRHWSGRYFIHYKDDFSAHQRVMCDEDAFENGVINCFGYSCLLCGAVFFPGCFETYSRGLDDCLRVRHTEAGRFFRALHCAKCEHEYRIWEEANYALVAEAVKTIKAYKQASKRGYDLMLAELEAVPKGPGIRARRREIEAKYRRNEIDEGDVWKALAARWLLSKVSPQQPKETAKYDAHAKRQYRSRNRLAA